MASIVPALNLATRPRPAGGTILPTWKPEALGVPSLK